MSPEVASRKEVEAMAEQSDAEMQSEVRKEGREKVLEKFAALIGTTQIQPSAANRAHMGNMGSIASSTHVAHAAASAGLLPGINLSGLMGINSISPVQSASNELTRCLVNDPSTLCTFPSLDMFSADVDVASLAGGTDKPAASAGPTSSSPTPSTLPTATSVPTTASMPPPAPMADLQRNLHKPGQIRIPAMAASVLNFPAQQGTDYTALTQDHRPNTATTTNTGVSPPATAAQPSPSTQPSTNQTSEALTSTADNNATGKTPPPEPSSPNNTKEETRESLEKRASKNMAEPISWTRSSSPQAPMTMLRSLSTSFSSLVDSRMRTWTLVLLRHSLNSGDDKSRSRLLALLAASSSITFSAIVTTFQTLKLPKEFASAKAEAEGKMVMPLIFEAVIDVQVLSTQTTVRLRAPGTISGAFAEDALLMKKVEVTLDTKSLLASMIEQARVVVFQAAAAATAVPQPVAASLSAAPANVAAHGSDQNQLRQPPEHHQNEPKPPQQQDEDHANTVPSGLLVSSASNAAAVGTTSSSAATSTGQGEKGETGVKEVESVSDLKPRPAQVSPPASPLQSFASMKLVSKLTSRRSTEAFNLSKNKNRSVTWNDPIEEPKAKSAVGASSMNSITGSVSGSSVVQGEGVAANRDPNRDAKRRKMSLLGANKLRSSKSFGKPLASIFECKRNATFAEFGRVEKSRHMRDAATDSGKPSGPISQAYSTAHISGRSHGLRRNGGTQNASFSLTAGGSKSSAAAAVAAGRRVVAGSSAASLGQHLERTKENAQVAGLSRNHVFNSFVAAHGGKITFSHPASMSSFGGSNSSLSSVSTAGGMARGRSSGL